MVEAVADSYCGNADGISAPLGKEQDKSNEVFGSTNLEGGRELALGAVVASEAVDTRLDENEAELGVLVVAVALEVLANLDGLLDCWGGRGIAWLVADRDARVGGAEEKSLLSCVSDERERKIKNNRQGRG